VLVLVLHCFCLFVSFPVTTQLPGKNGYSGGKVVFI